MKIGSFDMQSEVFVVAEIGNNHEGNFDLAKKMIALAAQSGAHAVKFQTIVPEKLVTTLDQVRINQLKKFQFSYKQFEDLKDEADRQKIIFLSTPFDLESAKFLEHLVPAFKIASGDNNFYPLLECVAQTAKPLIISSGLADLAQIKKTKTFVENIWRKKKIKQDLAILHCVSSYPTEPEKANLLAIRQLQKLGMTVGYSDHTLGIEAAVTAVSLDARIIEKHFTLDKNYSSFRDHQLSADPAEFTEMVKRIKQATILRGDGRISPLKSGLGDGYKIRRSVIANRDLEKGTKLKLEDIAWVRPGGGLNPGEEGLVIGKILSRAVKKGEMILATDVKK